MHARVEPIKRSHGNAIITMPLRKNVPLPQSPDWKLTICLECGRKCWGKPLPEGYRSGTRMCTECASRKAVTRNERNTISSKP